MTKPTLVYNRKGTEFGILTGGNRRCQLECCKGMRLEVLWLSGEITRPCSEGMFVRKDGQWQIGSAPIEEKA